MKHARIIMAMLVLLVAASLAEAQIVVSSTTASTTHVKKERPKSGREKGWVIRPEIEFGSGYNGRGNVGVMGTACYQINPYFSVGGGAGYLMEVYYTNKDDRHQYSGNRHFDFSGSFDFHFLNESRPSSIPVFINARVYFMDRKWSPFLDVKLGYVVPIKKGVYSYDMTYSSDLVRHSDVTETMQGFSIGGTIGMQYKNIDFGITARTLNVQYVVQSKESVDGMLYTNDGNDHLGYFGLTIAYNIPIKK